MTPSYQSVAQADESVAIESRLKLPPVDKIPPWRNLVNNASYRAESFVPSEEDLKMVNFALTLRKPLFIEGYPGCGKSSLVDYVARELKLGPVYKWHINSRSTRKEGLYHYDAISRMAELSKADPASTSVGKYVTLGPLGTALLPSNYPRALLIDEIDKADIDLPNDLLNILENGFFEIEEITRDISNADKVRVRKAKGFSVAETPPTETNSDEDIGTISSSFQPYVKIDKTGVQASLFPFIVITSNKEREMPAPFLRRCLRYEMKRPDKVQLKKIVEKHLSGIDLNQLQEWIDLFAKLSDENLDRPVDDLIESIFLFMQQGGLSNTMSNEDREKLKTEIRSRIWEVDFEMLEKLGK